MKSDRPIVNITTNPCPQVPVLPPALTVPVPYAEHNVPAQVVPTNVSTSLAPPVVATYPVSEKWCLNIGYNPGFFKGKQLRRRQHNPNGSDIRTRQQQFQQ